MTKTERILIEFFGGRIIQKDGQEIVIGLKPGQMDELEKLAEILEEEGLSDYEPSQAEINLRCQQIITDTQMDAGWGEHKDYGDECYFVFNSWDDVKKLSSFYRERYGSQEVQIEYDFSDSNDFCCFCGGVVRTQPDSYGWQRRYWEDGLGDIFCFQCLEENETLKEDYVEHCLTHDTSIDPDLAELWADGWIRLEEDFTNGLHYGQNADIEGLYRLLRASEYDILFSHQSGQFDTTFFVWCKEDDKEEVEKLIERFYKPLPYDPATELGKALRGEPTEYYTVTKIELTKEEFISGDWARED